MAAGIDLADIRLLREEANLIHDLIARLKSQLNRLKIEEMHLRSTIRGNDIKNVTGFISNSTPTETDVKTERIDDEHVNALELNLNVDLSNYIYDLPSAEEDEEMEEDESSNDDYSTFKETSNGSDFQDDLNYFLTDSGAM